TIILQVAGNPPLEPVLSTMAPFIALSVAYPTGLKFLHHWVTGNHRQNKTLELVFS
ncbi:MAG: hypothetical protein ACI85S_002632, partial [Pseudohongiellaceae bacterium]